MLMWIVGAGFLSLFDLAREHRSVILPVIVDSASHRIERIPIGENNDW